MHHKFKPMTAYRNENQYSTWDIYITRIQGVTEDAVIISYLFMDRLGFIRDIPLDSTKILFKDVDNWQEVENHSNNNDVNPRRSHELEIRLKQECE